MKRPTIAMLCLLLCLLLTGCNTEYAEIEYASPEKITSEGDRYTKLHSQFDVVEDGCRLTASRYDGRETLWTEHMEEAETIRLDLRLTLTDGQVKLVHVDGEDNLTTLLECTPETDEDGFVTVSVQMPKGRNKLKVVGYGCRNLTCEWLMYREREAAEP